MSYELLTIAMYTVIFLFGITIGSFLNVCIYRIPRGETVVTTPSHCMTCGHKLSWFELVPLFSYVFLRGRCRKCKSRISPQYPIVEGINGFLYLLVFFINGFTVESVIFSLFTSALLVLTVIDWRTYEIPISINIFILVLGCLRVVLDFNHLRGYLIGFFAAFFRESLYNLMYEYILGQINRKIFRRVGSYKVIYPIFFNSRYGNVSGSHTT